MKSRIIVFILAFAAIALFGTEKLVAQEFFTSVDQILLNIDANQTSEVRKSFTYTVVFFNRNLHIYNDMELFVKLNEEIANGNGGVIDPTKIKIELKQIIKGPRSDQIIPKTVLLRKQSQKVIEAKGGILNRFNIPARGETWTFLFDIIIDAKDLKDLENGLYPLNLDFNLSMELYYFLAGYEWFYSNATSIGAINVVNYAPTFGFEVNANASLNFTKPEDYTKQVESTGTSWLKVISKNTPYIVRVKTNDTDFVGDKGTVPVNVVSMKVDGPPNSASGAVPTVSLSNSEQVVYRGKATGANQHILDVRYFITKSEAEKLATKTPGEYTTTLTYTLSPP